MDDEQLHPGQPGDGFEVRAASPGFLIITTNPWTWPGTGLNFVRWKEIFGDEALTGALLDRLTHRCHILELNGKSYPWTRLHIRGIVGV